MTPDKIIELLMEIKVELGKNTENLKEHMRRTEIAESRLDGVEKSIAPIVGKIAQAEGVLKFIGVVSAVVSIIAGIIKFFHG
jgi:hypothetical protein